MAKITNTMNNNFEMNFVSFQDVDEGEKFHVELFTNDNSAVIAVELKIRNNKTRRIEYFRASEIFSNQWVLVRKYGVSIKTLRDGENDLFTSSKLQDYLARILQNCVELDKWLNTMGLHF